MAQTSRDALSGVDFLTRLALSATNGAPAFQQACSDAGVAPASLDAARRGALDQAMQARFDQAAQSGQSRSPWAPPPAGCATCSRPAESVPPRIPARGIPPETVYLFLHF
ncbi:hypothetical protein WJ972_28855 [Achromobacter insuavis]